MTRTSRRPGTMTPPARRGVRDEDGGRTDSTSATTIWSRRKPVRNATTPQARSGTRFFGERKGEYWLDVRIRTSERIKERPLARERPTPTRDHEIGGRSATSSRCLLSRRSASSAARRSRERPLRHVTYSVHRGRRELITKPTHHSVNELRRIGIHRTCLCRTCEGLSSPCATRSPSSPKS